MAISRAPSRSISSRPRAAEQAATIRIEPFGRRGRHQIPVDGGYVDVAARTSLLSSRSSTAYPPRAVHKCRFHLTSACERLTSRRPVRLRVLAARHRMGRTGCGVPRVCLARNSREAPETRPPPLRADAISAFTRVFDALWSSQTVKRTCFIPRGPGPTIAAVERREASIPDGMQGASQAPAGVRHSPADGCRCTRAPVGAPLPSLFFVRGNWQTSEDRCLAGRMKLA